MATLSLDLRQRILSAYDRGDSTRGQVARRFEVSEGMVKKLLAQRKQSGDISPQHHRSGRKPKIQSSHRRQLKNLVSQEPDLTLEELRSRLGLDCTIQAIHYVLVDMGISYKKRRSVQQNRTAKTSAGRDDDGKGDKEASLRKGSFS